MKPMLASDAVESKIKYPCIIQPKIDGVRGLNEAGKLIGRSLKAHANKYTTAFYSKEHFAGFDGELAAAGQTDPALCRLTTSALSTIEGEPFTLWHVFDLINETTSKLPYTHRLSVLSQRIQELIILGHGQNLRMIESVLVPNLDSLLSYENAWLAQGYEGIIIRDPNGLHKQGRSTPTEGGLLRIKRFVEDEALVLELVEGETNLNEAKVNELGNTARSTHQANMVSNGMVGAMICKDIKTGNIITVSAGSMPHDLRKYYFENPKELVGQVIKYKHFPKGVKDKPRFPTYQSIRAASDIGVKDV